MARNRPVDSAEQRPKSGAKQTQGGHTGMSQCDPERTRRGAGVSTAIGRLFPVERALDAFEM
jgi:hypothetical protein